MKERPILFNAPMVRSMLDGSKTQTRRVVKYSITGPNPPGETFDWHDSKGKWLAAHGHGFKFDKTNAALLCPYGQPGDRLWVRETWRGVVNIAPPGSYEYAVARYVPDQQHCRRVEYAASKTKDSEPWRPSIHMPRWASRITLEITAARAERLQDISEADAIAEGVSQHPNGPWHAYRSLWTLINGPGSWDLNPWVWVIEFKKATP